MPIHDAARGLAAAMIDDAIPAATLVILRDTDGAPPDLLMIERAAAMAFAGGATVFPGGRVDPGDRALAASLGGDPDDTAARIAAIRETLEETGLAIGFARPPAPAAAQAMRAALHAGTPFAELLTHHGATLALDLLTPFARWRPDRPRTRTFDARFYLAASPDDASGAAPDGAETVALGWASAAGWLAGGARLIFPTRRNLERLARFDSFAAAVADAHAHPVETITPWPDTSDGVEGLRIPEGLGYPVTFEPVTDAVRG